MTISGWIVFAIIAGCLILGAICGAVLCEYCGKNYDPNYLCACNNRSFNRNAVVLWEYCQRAEGYGSQQSDLGNGLDRIVRVYTATGDIIAEFEGKIDIEGNDGGYVLFDYEGKRYTYYNCFVESIAEIGG